MEGVDSFLVIILAHLEEQWDNKTLRCRAFSRPPCVLLTI